MHYCSMVAVLPLVSLTKKRFGHYAILKILSLGSPSEHVTMEFLSSNDFRTCYPQGGGGGTSIMSSTEMFPKFGYPFLRKIVSLRYVFGGKIPWMTFH